MIIYCPLKFMNFNVETPLLQELNRLNLFLIKLIKPRSYFITVVKGR